MRALLKRLWGTKRRRRILLLTAPIVLVGFSILSIEATSTSTFCNSCHIMNTYHASWERSKHKDVSCVECHIAPGLDNLVMAKLNGMGQALDDMLNRTSTLPSASVSDLSCARAGCHEVDKVRALPRKEKPYFFSHDKHLGLKHAGIEVHCTTCHSHTTGENHFEMNTNACVACHLIGDPSKTNRPQLASAPAAGAYLVSSGPAGEAPATDGPKPAAPKTATNRCRDCHQPPADPVVYNGLTVVHSEYVEYGASCESCHRGVTAKPAPIDSDRCMGCHDFGRERITTVHELHEQHTTGRHKVECFSCHGRVRHGPSAQTMQLAGIDCRACHQGQHEIQQETYQAAAGTTHATTAGAAVTPMFLAHVDCTGCHVQPRDLRTKPGTGQTVAAATPAACDACHKPGLGEQMVPLWQKNTRDLYNTVERMLPDPSKPMPTPRAERLVAEARQLLALVRLDGSWGVHNPPYTQKLIEQARERLSEAATAVARAEGRP